MKFLYSRAISPRFAFSLQADHLSFPERPEINTYIQGYHFGPGATPLHSLLIPRPSFSLRAVGSTAPFTFPNPPVKQLTFKATNLKEGRLSGGLGESTLAYKASNKYR